MPDCTWPRLWFSTTTVSSLVTPPGSGAGVAGAELVGAALGGAVVVGAVVVGAEYSTTSWGGFAASLLSKYRVAVAPVVRPNAVPPARTAPVTSASVHWPAVRVPVVATWAPSAGRLAQVRVRSSQLAEVLNTFDRVIPVERENRRRVALATVPV